MKILVWLYAKFPNYMAWANARHAKNLEKALANLSEFDIALVLALCIDHRNHVIAQHQIDIFESPEANRANRRQFAAAAKDLWLYFGRQPKNKKTELSRRVTTITAAGRDCRVSNIWKQMIRGQSRAREAARNWEAKHNQLLRVEDTMLVPKELDLTD